MTLEHIFMLCIGLAIGVFIRLPNAEITDRHVYSPPTLPKRPMRKSKLRRVK